MTGTGRLGRELPSWPVVLAVVAHPDDESFGLGGVIGRMTSAGADVHVLCFTHGEASALNETSADLRQARAAELREAGAELGVATVTLLGYPDGGLAAIAPAELAAQVRSLASLVRPDGLLVFDDTGITGHPDHRAATAAAFLAARDLGHDGPAPAPALAPVPAPVPILAWTLTEPVARRLRAVTGQPFAGRSQADLDLRIIADRTRQRAAALRHASQISPGAVLWRRLELQRDAEYLRWLRPLARHSPGAATPG